MAKTAGRVHTETGRKRVRAYLDGELVADTRQPLLVWEWPYFPVYYIPAADVRAELVPNREDRALAQPWRRGDLRRDRRPGDGAGRGPALPGLPAGGAARRGAAGLGRDERVVRGGRAGLHPPAGPVLAGGHPGQFPARPGRGGRGHGGGFASAADPVRDRPAAALLPAADRRPDGPAPPVGDPVALPVQGDRGLLVGGGGRPGAPRPRLDLPHPAAGEPEDRRAGLLLRREGGRLPGRGAAAPAADALTSPSGISTPPSKSPPSPTCSIPATSPARSAPRKSARPASRSAQRRSLCPSISGIAVSIARAGARSAAAVTPWTARPRRAPARRAGR